MDRIIAAQPGKPTFPVCPAASDRIQALWLAFSTIASCSLRECDGVDAAMEGWLCRMTSDVFERVSAVSIYSPLLSFRSTSHILAPNIVGICQETDDDRACIKPL